MQRLITVMAILVAPAFAASPAAAPDAALLQLKTAAAVERDLGLAVNAGRGEARLQLLDGPHSLPPGARLYVASVKPGFAPGSFFLRIDCTSRRDCLPFEVLLRTENSNELPVRAGVARNDASAGASNANPPTKSLSAVVARSGDRVELVEELAGMKLSVKAMCLDSGGIGDRIRVRNLNSHHVILARVAGPGQVRVE